MTTAVDVFIAVCVLSGALLVLVSALAMFRAKDALSRINVFSPATGLGMPLVVVGCYVYTLQQEGFSLYRLFIGIIAFLALIIVSSIASNTLSRATLLSGSPVHRYTRPDRLAYARGEDPRADGSAGRRGLSAGERGLEDGRREAPGVGPVEAPGEARGDDDPAAT